MSDLFTLAHATDGVRRLDLTTLRLELGYDEANDFVARLRSEHCIVLGSDPVAILKTHEALDLSRPFSDFLEMASAELAQTPPSTNVPPPPKEDAAPHRGYGNRMESETATVQEEIRRMKDGGRTLYSVRYRLCVVSTQYLHVFATSEEEAKAIVNSRPTTDHRAPPVEGRMEVEWRPENVLVQLGHAMQQKETLAEAGWEMTALEVTAMSDDDLAQLARVNARRRLAMSTKFRELTLPALLAEITG